MIFHLINVLTPTRDDPEPKQFEPWDASRSDLFRLDKTLVLEDISNN